MITWYSHDLTCTSPFLLAACEADLLFPITNEGSVSSIRCSQIHPSFNPFGLAVSFCPLLIQQELASRVSDVSQCTFNTEANSHVVFVRITIIGGQGRFPFYSAEQNTGLIMSQVLHTHTHACIHTHTPHTHTHWFHTSPIIVVFPCTEERLKRHAHIEDSDVFVGLCALPERKLWRQTCKELLKDTHN